MHDFILFSETKPSFQDIQICQVIPLLNILPLPPVPWKIKSRVLRLTYNTIYGCLTTLLFLAVHPIPLSQPSKRLISCACHFAGIHVCSKLEFLNLATTGILDQVIFVVDLLCIVGQKTAFLTSTHQMSSTTPHSATMSPDVTKYLLRSKSIPP